MRKEPKLQKPVKAGKLKKDTPTDPVAAIGTTVIYHKPNCPAYAKQGDDAQKKAGDGKPLFPPDL